MIRKEGRRNSKADLEKIQRVHDDTVDLGADCVHPLIQQFTPAALCKVTHSSLRKIATPSAPIDDNILFANLDGFASHVAQPVGNEAIAEIRKAVRANTVARIGFLKASHLLAITKATPAGGVEKSASSAWQAPVMKSWQDFARAFETVPLAARMVLQVEQLTEGQRRPAQPATVEDTDGSPHPAWIHTDSASGRRSK